MTDVQSLASRARHVLPPDVYGYYAAGGGAEVTLGEQERAWDALRLRPRVLRDVSSVSTATTLFGAEFATPIAIAPTAMHGFAHPDGELATASAACEAGALMVVSTRSSRTLADIAATGVRFWQQIYVLQDRALSDAVARRAAEAGAGALVLTVDTPVVARKVFSMPADPPGTRRLVPELESVADDDPRLAQALDVTVADIARLREVSGLPVVVKGVLRADEARRCVDAGAQAVIVSTHGGRQLDPVVPVPVALPEVVASVTCDVYADGGIRSAPHVLGALALGARMVFLGRPVLWALAAGGRDGVRDLLTGLTDELAEALTLAGCVSPSDVGPDLLG